MKLIWLHFLSLLCSKVYADYKDSNEDTTSIGIFASLVAPYDSYFEWYPIDIDEFDKWEKFVNDKQINEDNIYDICLDFLKWCEQYGFDFSIVEKWLVEKNSEEEKKNILKIVFDENLDFYEAYGKYVESSL